MNAIKVLKPLLNNVGSNKSIPDIKNTTDAITNITPYSKSLSAILTLPKKEYINLSLTGKSEIGPAFSL